MLDAVFRLTRVPAVSQNQKIFSTSHVGASRAPRHTLVCTALFLVRSTWQKACPSVHLVCHAGLRMLPGDYMDGDHPIAREGIMPFPTGNPHLHNVSAPSPPGVPPYPNMGVHMAYNVFSGKGAPASPAFYANGVPPAYPGIYVAPQVRRY